MCTVTHRLNASNESPDGCYFKAYDKEIVMRKTWLGFAAVLILGALICLPGMASADTILLNFDDVSSGDPIPQATPLPTNYGGFEWSGTGGYWGIVPNSYYRSYYGNSFNFPSNPNAVTNESPDQIGAPQVVISSPTAFDFDGAWFGTWTAYNSRNYYGATSLTITGKLGSTVVGTTTFALTPGALSWQEVDFHGIDTLIFDVTAGSAGRYFLMDNFTDTAVPIPPTVLLMGSGLLGLVILRSKAHTQKRG
jgi:hypothetical protein